MNIRKKAFSIIEISIATGVLMCLLLPVLTMMTRSSKGTIRNKYEILAQMHCSNIIAICNSRPFNHEMMKETEERDVGEIEIKAGAIIKKFDLDEAEKNIFKRTITIKDFSSDDLPYKYKLIIAKVEWNQSGEKKRNVMMASLVTE